MKIKTCITLFLLALVSTVFSVEVKLEGLAFFNEVEDINKNIAAFKGIDMQYIAAPEENLFKEKMEQFIGQDITMKLFEDIRVEILQFYCDRERSLVSVFFPAGQDITDGTLSVLVLEGKLGNIRFEGNSFFSDETLLRSIRAEPGEIIDQRRINEDLLWINNNNFRSVELIYDRGEELGTTDIVVRVKDQIPVKISAGMVHSRFPVGDMNRWDIGLGYGNLWGLDHDIYVKFMVEQQFKEFKAFSGSYTIPLPWRHTVKLFSSYVKTSADRVGDIGQVKGRSWQVGMRYQIPLKDRGNYHHEWSWGFDFNRTNNFLDFRGFDRDSLNSYVDIAQFLLRYEGGYVGPKNIFGLGVSLYGNPGGIGQYNENEYYSSGAEVPYYFLEINYDNNYRLPKNFTLVQTGLAQVTPCKLLPSRQIYAGGEDTVRGFPENVATGNTGVVFRDELRLPPWTFPFGDLQVLGFWDSSYLDGVDIPTWGQSYLNMQSVGAGLRYTNRGVFSLKVDYGHQIKRLPKRSEKRCLHVNIMAVY
jgi:hemolysin activation/secretion protein